MKHAHTYVIEGATNFQGLLKIYGKIAPNVYLANVAISSNMETAAIIIVTAIRF